MGMFSLTAKVCDTRIGPGVGADAGTDDDVKLRCKRFNGDSCITDILDKRWEDDFEQGSTETWNKEWLGNCTDFKPIKDLKCRFVLENFRRDSGPLKMCKLTLDFGSRILPRRRTVWEWSGERVFTHSEDSFVWNLETGYWDKTKKESENWLEMQRRQR